MCGGKMFVQMSASDIYRFQCFSSELNDKCLPWSGGRGWNNYGHFWLNGKTYLAHRVAYFMANGEFPDELEVLHECDNPPCVNPAHLFLGTSKDNTQDMLMKNRAVRGEDSCIAILTNEKVLEIRKLYLQRHSQRKIANMFNVSQSLISNVVTRKTWWHI